MKWQPMKRSILLYGLAVAAGATLLQWLEYRYLVRMTSTPIYVAAISVFFIALGAWTGYRLARPESAGEFERNEEAMGYLGISPREYEVLELLARGHTNREIAEALFVSPNTVKTHLSNVYDKLGASRRTQAVRKARSLRLIP